ncbi:hypothetical protein LY76DRAFT_599837 [Colletotrichum caudatum]|nr:hypothetical protein LY76DRAFT_599837 [Colletotrichum caudatum]
MASRKELRHFCTAYLLPAYLLRTFLKIESAAIVAFTSSQLLSFITASNTHDDDFYQEADKRVATRGKPGARSVTWWIGSQSLLATLLPRAHESPSRPSIIVRPGPATPEPPEVLRSVLHPLDWTTIWSKYCWQCSVALWRRWPPIMYDRDSVLSATLHVSSSPK